LADGVSPTDALGYGLMTTGMGKRMGDDSKPPVALTLRQILWIMTRLESDWTMASTTAGRREIAAAAVVNLFGWLRWLRSQELFSLKWEDLRITRPCDGPRVGLPLGVGVLELRLLPETKSNRTKVADVVISYVSASGLQPGLWTERLRRLWPAALPQERLIRGSSGMAWTSYYFRRHHLYVWLHQMRTAGDPFLQAFTSEHGNRLEDKYYSFGTYRRGGRSACTKRNNGTLKASTDEVYEHGRWRRRIGGEDMSTRYNEFGLDDRLHITLLCM
jgi:hypothetical protein